jgi:hypothetical protein
MFDLGPLRAKGITYRGVGTDEPVEEVLVFHGGIVSFECEVVDGEIVRVPGKAYPLGSDGERAECMADLHQQAQHIDACDCPRHEDMWAEVIEFNTTKGESHDGNVT